MLGSKQSVLMSASEVSVTNTCDPHPVRPGRVELENSSTRHQTNVKKCFMEKEINQKLNLVLKEEMNENVGSAASAAAVPSSKHLTRTLCCCKAASQQNNQILTGPVSPGLFLAQSLHLNPHAARPGFGFCPLHSELWEHVYISPLVLRSLT